MNTIALTLGFLAILALSGGCTAVAQGLALAGLAATGLGFIWRTDRSRRLGYDRRLH